MNEKINPACAGESFDDFLKEQGMYEEAHAHAVKSVIAWQISEEMKRQGLSKLAMARRMGTSRSSLDRLLDPANDALALSTLTKAANILGKGLEVRLV